MTTAQLIFYTFYRFSMSIRDLATGTVITLLIGGTAYTVSQTDVIRNFADNTGLTQEQAEQYIDEISEDELSSFGDEGSELIDWGQELLSGVSEVDCVNHEYEWETPTLSCVEGKAQLRQVGSNIVALGQAYKKLDSESGSIDDIPETIRLIDQQTSDYQLEIFSWIFTPSETDYNIKTNLYNKAILQAILESG